MKNVSPFFFALGMVSFLGILPARLVAQAGNPDLAAMKGILTTETPVASLPVSSLPPGLFVVRVGTASGQMAWARFVIVQ